LQLKQRLSKDNTIITLVNSNVAKNGYKFVFEKPSEICLTCNLRKVCVERLEQGRIYEIIKVRDKKHFCKLLNDFVSVVEVKLSPIEIFVERRIALEGVIVSYNPIECKTTCLNKSLCAPLGLFKNDKIKIEKILHHIKCQNGKNLAKVLVTII